MCFDGKKVDWKFKCKAFPTNKDTESVPKNNINV